MHVKIKVISGEEFHKELLARLVKENENVPLEELIGDILANGFEKFSFDNLSKILPKYFVWFKPVLVDFGQVGTEDYGWYWFVSGQNAVLVNKTDVDIEENSASLNS